MQSNHKMSRETGGAGMDSWIKPACSCGWTGTKHYAHDDYQLRNAAKQEQRHLDAIHLQTVP